MTPKPRRAQLVVKYNGTDISRDLKDYLLDFSYNDAESGSADDITLSLEDTDLKWINSWFPKHGDRIIAEIIPFDWEKPGDKLRLQCGSFEVDSMEFSGPPDVVSVKATSIPVGKAGRLTKRTKAWEKATLKSIAAEVAKRCGLKLSYNSKANPTYDRLDQTDMTDVEFLNTQAAEEGLALKVSADQLVLFDEKDFEEKAPLFTLDCKESGLLNYSFSYDSAFVAYASATISYTPPKPPAVKKKNDDRKKGAKAPAPTTPKIAATPTTPAPKDPPAIKVSYTAPGAPKGGPVLSLNESVSSEAEALKAARKALRENNKNAGKASFSMMGNVKAVAGVTFNAKGFGRFDGKYIVVSASHSVGDGGYTTSIEARKVLEW